jgi:hypothetical protein
MFARLGPARPAQGTDLIARAVGAWVLATLAITPPPGTQAAPRRRRLAASRPKKQATTEGGLSR